MYWWWWLIVMTEFILMLMTDSYDWVMLIVIIDDVNVNAWNINLMIKNAMIIFMSWCYAMLHAMDRVFS